MTTASSSRQSFEALWRFAPKQSTAACCELCGAGLAEPHDHLVDPAKARLLCVCQACQVLFSSPPTGRYRRVPRQAVALSGFCLDDVAWTALNIPIKLAFVFRSTPAGRVVAMYPSAAGAIEAVLPTEAWRKLELDNPSLERLQPDVQALLINRLTAPYEYYLAPIDQCYSLVGLIRTYWRGFSGGDVWGHIGQFFQSLRQQCAGQEAACRS